MRTALSIFTAAANVVTLVFIFTTNHLRRKAHNRLVAAQSHTTGLVVSLYGDLAELTERINQLEVP